MNMKKLSLVLLLLSSFGLQAGAPADSQDPFSLLNKKLDLEPMKETAKQFLSDGIDLTSVTLVPIYSDAAAASTSQSIDPVIQALMLTNQTKQTAVPAAASSGTNMAAALILHKAKMASKQKHVCVHCDKTFTRSSDVTTHTRIHTGERPYACDYPDCGRKFIQNSDLTRHLKIHNKGKK